MQHTHVHTQGRGCEEPYGDTQHMSARRTVASAKVLTSRGGGEPTPPQNLLRPEACPDCVVRSWYIHSIWSLYAYSTR